MDTIRLFPRPLRGTVYAPSSKSMGHREIICAGRAAGTSVVENISMSEDIRATCRCLRALGTLTEEVPGRIAGRSALRITGGRLRAAQPGADCGESGSTLRFFIPLAMLLGENFTFTGRGKLPGRPLNAYYDLFAALGLHYTNDGGRLPLTVNGVLPPGTYRLPGDVSSQFVSGLLFALPLAAGASVIEITSPLESAPYVDLTLSCLRAYGVEVANDNHRRYRVPGGQRYQARSGCVEGDWSQAAFWLVGGTLGEEITCGGLNLASLQGDRAIMEIVRRMGGRIARADNAVSASAAATRAAVIDGSACPDIIPVLSVLAAVSAGTTEIINAGRLRIKECDRLAAMAAELTKLGACVEELPEGLRIQGRPEGLRGGAEVEAWNDHRVAMSLAIAAQKCKEPVILRGAGSVRKSYPDFWRDYVSLGGDLEVLA